MATQDPKILSAPPIPDSVAGGSVTVNPQTVTGSHTPAGSPASDPSGQVDQLRAEMVRDRFDAAAARAGIAEEYTDVALALFEKTGAEPSKENLSKFCADLRKNRPALFGPTPAQTSPVPLQAAPTTPAPGAVANHFSTWQALESAGRKAEAEAFYRLNRHAINRQG